ncbi:MgtC/SapB family protein [Planctomicrobium sp. SH661]|uniref:MgtC/SapB family protein n=1 Tax=Planctomicrobium sp. SH661 TaxID=3448124 RepID=UPI003F5C2760
MSLTLEWPEVALRLVLTVIAGGLIGHDRGERGHAAGLRTTILVCLAAAVSMIQVNLMLSMAGSAPNSFIKLDLMRLPLGVLSGMGFIGGGAILRREKLVTGVTTAATLWYVTIMGLCLGAGEYGLGLAMLGIGLLVLKSFRSIEKFMTQEQRATLLLVLGQEGPTEEEITRSLRDEHFKIVSVSVADHHSELHRRRKLRYYLKHHVRRDDIRIPPIIQNLSQLPGLVRFEWSPEPK